MGIDVTIMQRTESILTKEGGTFMNSVVNRDKLLGKPILTICPTRERLVKCKKMLDSFEDCESGYSDIVFCVDENDPCLKDYEALFKDRVAYIVGEQTPITKKFNETVFYLHDYIIFHMSNDDFVYKTPFFDEMIVKEWGKKGTGVYFGDDGFWHDTMCVAPFVTADLVKAFGWIQLPELTHLCNDLVLEQIARGLDSFYYLPDVLIKHIHPETVGVEKDNVTLRVNSPEMYAKDKIQYIIWKMQRYEVDVARVRASLRDAKSPRNTSGDKPMVKRQSKKQ